MTAIIAPESIIEMSAEDLGFHAEENWESLASDTRAFAYVFREMQRRFKIRDRHKKVDGTYHTIRGFTSFKAWFHHATGKSYRAAYYALRAENAKHKPRGGIHKHRILKLRVTLDQYKGFELLAKTHHVSTEQWALNILNHKEEECMFAHFDNRAIVLRTLASLNASIADFAALQVGTSFSKPMLERWLRGEKHMSDYEEKKLVALVREMEQLQKTFPAKLDFKDRENIRALLAQRKT